MIRFKDICFGCLKQIDSRTNHYCSACRKRLFHNSRIDYRIGIDPDTLEGPPTLMLKRARFHPEPDGDFLLETAPAASGIRYPEDIPANRHLMNCIARQIFDLPTEPQGIVFVHDDALALIRWRQACNRELCRPFETLFASPTPSYQEIAQKIIFKLPARVVELENFFSLVLFHYMIGNATADLRAFSLQKRPSGDYGLAPLSDALSSVVHFHDEATMALPLLETLSNREGLLSREDFLRFARLITLEESTATDLLGSYSRRIHDVFDLTERSLLSSAAKKLFKKHYFDRVQALGQGT